MAIGSGLGAQLGISTEGTVGTYAAPTTFLEFTSESIELTKDYVETFGLRAGRTFQSSSLHAATTRHAEGSVVLDVLDQGFGKILNLLHGNVVTPSALTGGLYRQTHNIGLTSSYGKALGVQVGRPDVSGTVRAFSYLGCKVTGITFSLERGGVVTAEVTIDAIDEVTTETLGTATYSTSSVPFNFLNASIEFADVVLTDCVSSATVSIAMPMATDRFCIGGAGVKKEPIQNGPNTVDIALDMEFTSLTQHAAFTASTLRKVELNCTGTTTSGTYSSALNFTAATTKAVSSGPKVEGPDVLTQAVSLKVLDSGSGTPLVVQYDSADASL